MYEPAGRAALPDDQRGAPSRTPAVAGAPSTHHRPAATGGLRVGSGPVVVAVVSFVAVLLGGLAMAEPTSGGVITEPASVRDPAPGRVVPRSTVNRPVVPQESAQPPVVPRGSATPPAPATSVRVSPAPAGTAPARDNGRTDGPAGIPRGDQ